MYNVLVGCVELLVECVKTFIYLQTIKFKKWHMDYKIHMLETKIKG